MSRRFMVIRRVDETGVSGTGHVADGIEFDDGTVCVRWRTEHRSTIVFESLAAAEAIHGHGGKTTFQFHDDAGATAWLCCMCFADMDVPLNHCYMCGSSGSAVAMAEWQLKRIQNHDKLRLASLDELHAEASVLRALAVRVFGPAALGLQAERGGRDSYPSLEYRNSLYGISPGPEGESEMAFLCRGAECVAFDPKHLRALLREKQDHVCVDEDMTRLEDQLP